MVAGAGKGVSRSATARAICGGSLPPQMAGSVLAENIRFEPFAPFPMGARLAVVLGHMQSWPICHSRESLGRAELMSHGHPNSWIAR
jgi:hypothetical protein